MSRLIDIASTELGVSEIEGSIHNDRILGYAKEAGFDWVESDEVPWCSIFLNWAAKKGGLERSENAKAQSWTEVGEKIEHPEPGDIVLLTENGSHIYHVGIFTGFNPSGNLFFCLGGNQRNKVSIAPFPSKHIHSFRRLASLQEKAYSSYVAESKPAVEETILESANPVFHSSETNPLPSKIFVPAVKLRHGDAGIYVESLQTALRAIGAYKGKIDGVFGVETALAITRFREKSGVSSKSVYNRKTRKLIIAALEQKGIGFDS